MAEPMAVAETTVRGFKKAIQDFVAPEIRDLKGEVGKINIRIDALNTTINTRIDGMENKLSTRIDGPEKLMDTQYKAIRDQQDTQFKAILAAIGESKAISELESFKLNLSQRVSALEAARTGT